MISWYEAKLLLNFERSLIPKPCQFEKLGAIWERAYLSTKAIWRCKFFESQY